MENKLETMAQMVMSTDATQLSEVPTELDVPKK